MTVDQMAEGHLVASLRAGDEIAGHRASSQQASVPAG
jgi:hypothetical protein